MLQKYLNAISYCPLPLYLLDPSLLGVMHKGIFLINAEATLDNTVL